MSTSGKAQPGEDNPNPGFCDCCEGLAPPDGINPSEAYIACQFECENDVTYCNNSVPLHVNNGILFTVALSLGLYTIYKNNKKRRFEN